MHGRAEPKLKDIALDVRMSNSPVTSTRLALMAPSSGMFRRS